MPVVRLKPRETRVFENEQKSRLVPNALVTGIEIAPDGTRGIPAVIVLSPDETTHLDGSISIVNNQGRHPKALRILDDDTVVSAGAFTLENDGVVNPPAKLGLVLIDIDNSITNYVVTIDGEDEIGSVIQEQFTFPGAGKVRTTTNLFRKVTGVSGGAISGTFTGDLLRLGVALGTEAHHALGGHEAHSFGGGATFEDDPNNPGDTDKGSYIQAAATTDQKVLVAFPPLPADVVAITLVTVRFQTKNLTATANGIEYILKHSGVEYILGADVATTADGSQSKNSNLGTLAIAPGTGLPWTVGQLNAIELGVRFKGDNPTVTKQLMAVRLIVNAVTQAVGSAAPIVDNQAVEVVGGDPFTEADATYLPFYSADRVSWGFPALPVEAIGVLNVRAKWRFSSVNHGHPNGIARNARQCAEGGAAGNIQPAVQPRGGTGLHLDWGNIEAGNVGCARISASSPSGSLEFVGPNNGSGASPRVALGPGNPTGNACLNSANVIDGENLPWGTFYSFEHLWTGTPTSANPWTVAAWDGFESSFESGGFADGNEFRISTIWAEPEWLRSPTGALYLHLVLDDEIDAPNDSDYMESQHPSNKKVGVDFAGIPEVTSVDYVRAYVRGRKNPGALAGWRAVWRLGNDAGSDVVEAVETNDSFETKVYHRPLSPFTGLPWTRSEVNNLVIIFEAIGENAYHGKRVSVIGLEVSFDAIPEKVDAARDISSRKLRFLRKPRPFLTIELPPIFADADLLDDIPVVHNAIPRTSKTLGFERWDRSLMRVFKETLRLQRDTVQVTLFDLREFLTTLWIAGRSRSKGASVDGMAIITQGVTIGFLRATNDYFAERFAGLIQELAGDEPPVGIEGILIQGGQIQRCINSAFTEGAASVFTGWTKVVGAGGSIVEDLEDNAFDENIINGPTRSVFITGATTPSDGCWVERLMALPHGFGLSPASSAYGVSVEHKDQDAAGPISVSLEVVPPGFGARQYDWTSLEWVSTATPIWTTLPSSTERIRHELPPIRNLDVMPTGGGTEFTAAKIRVGARSLANQVNRLYTVQVEGGTVQSGEATQYPSSFILSRTGPVVRDGLRVSVPNFRTRPTYPAEGRGTFVTQVVPIWDSTQLPFVAGVKRYLYSLILDAFNRDILYYDCDAEKFIFERLINGVSAKAEFFYPGITEDEVIEVGTRWISSEGDLGEEPFSISIFVNGEQGTTSTVHAEALILPSESELVLGSNDAAVGTFFDGYFRNLEIRQLAMTQAAIARVFK